MKSVHLLLVALVICTFSLTTLSGITYAASKASTDNGKIASTATGVKKQVPRDVNINTADKQLLTQLPGIGPVTADSILRYRADNGQFASIEELTKVKGIGDKTLVKLKPYLYTL